MKLNTHVVCWDRMLQVHVFGPGDDLPEWAVKQITNPNVWEEPPSATPFAEPEGPEAFIPARPEQAARNERILAEAAAKLTPLEIPPKKGPKATVEAWREYGLAAAKRAGLNIDIPADAGRGDIIEALAEAGIATE